MRVNFFSSTSSFAHFLSINQSINQSTLFIYGGNKSRKAYEAKLKKEKKYKTTKIIIIVQYLFFLHTKISKVIKTYYYSSKIFPQF